MRRGVRLHSVEGLNDPPYVTEVFPIGDAASCARKDQKVPQYYNAEVMLRNVGRHGGEGAFSDMEVPMIRRLSLGAPILLLLSSTSSTGSFNPVADVVAQAPSSQSQQPREQSPLNMQSMMKMHEQMMAEMKAADSKLDALVKEMNTTTGDAKLNAVATVVAELVRQHRSMHERMGQMHQQMMGGRGMMMNK